MAALTVQRPTTARAPASVLLVEDEEVLRDVLRRNLEARHYRVQTAATATEAIVAVAAAPPAVMVLDINLPDRSGWDVLRELRARGRCVRTVVVSAVRCSPARLQEFQPDAYLPKPFPLAALLDAVQRLSEQPVDERTTGPLEDVLRPS